MIDTISINWEALGAEFANMEDTKQAKFFEQFAKEINRWPSSYHRNMQLMAVSDRLSDNAKIILEGLLPSLWYSQEE